MVPGHLKLPSFYLSQASSHDTVSRHGRQRSDDVSTEYSHGGIQTSRLWQNNMLGAVCMPGASLAITINAPDENNQRQIILRTNTRMPGGCLRTMISPVIKISSFHHFTHSSATPTADYLECISVGGKYEPILDKKVDERHAVLPKVGYQSMVGVRHKTGRHYIGLFIFVMEAFKMAAGRRCLLAALNRRLTAFKTYLSF